VQTLEEQVEISERLGILYPVISDPELALRNALSLPTFEFEGQTLYKRLTLVFEGGRVAKCFYPVFPPDRHAEEVVAWLGS
jgi:peroxiredoxin